MHASPQESILHRIHDSGHPLMPLRINSKLPLEKAWQKRPQKPWQLIQDFIRNGHPLGVRADNLTVVDWDNVDGARTWFNEHKSHIRMIVKTKRGVHFYFSRANEGNTTGLFDVRSGNAGYVVAPGSTISGFTYTCPNGYDNIENITPFNPAWLPQRETKPRTLIDVRGDMTYRAFKYVDAIPGVPEGRRDATCFAVACKLVRDFQLDVKEAWPILLSFNQRCDPPLTDMLQLKRKLYEALKTINARP